jgi:hypothetical protein
MAGPAAAGNSTVRPMQIGIGAVALIAALMIVRLRVRQRANVPTPASHTSILVLDSNTPTAISRPLGFAQDAAAKVGSAIRRLLDRAKNAWETDPCGSRS